MWYYNEKWSIDSSHVHAYFITTRHVISPPLYFITPHMEYIEMVEIHEISNSHPWNWETNFGELQFLLIN